MGRVSRGVWPDELSAVFAMAVVDGTRTLTLEPGAVGMPCEKVGERVGHWGLVSGRFLTGAALIHGSC